MANPAPESGSLLTTDPDQLVRALQPGDVIAFDSLRSISGLIQWADKAPVNHVGLISAPDTLVMANPATTDLNGEPVPPITASKLSGVLTGEHVHAVTVLRPRALGETQLAGMLDKVDWYLTHQADFSMMDIVWLAPSALMRSYSIAEAESVGPGAMKVLVGVLQASARAALARIRSSDTALTCSEFAYRCLVAGGFEVHIDHPIRRGFAAEWPPAIDAAEEENWAALAAHNAATRHGVPGSIEAAAGQVRADFVTPGDLWRSPSLDVAAIWLRDRSR